MICEIQAAGSIELYAYGELSPIARAHVRAHLERCAECRQALDDLRVIRAALASSPDVAAPPGGDWSGFMARLEGATYRAGNGERPAATDRVFTPARRRRLVPYLTLAALLGLVTVSVLMVTRHRSALPPSSSIEDSALSAEQGPAPRFAQDAAMVSVSGQHFERSKLVVLGLATKDPAQAGADGWVYERDLASSLLGDTRVYRQAAEARGMKSLAGVMRDLELVLLQTSMSEQPDAASLEHLQRLIRRRDLLAKMNAMYTGQP